jgi:hypothetical protein
MLMVTIPATPLPRNGGLNGRSYFTKKIQRGVPTVYSVNLKLHDGIIVRESNLFQREVHALAVLAVWAGVHANQGR